MRTKHAVTIHRDPDLMGVEFSQVRESAHRFPNHAHDYYIFGVMEAGAAYCLGKGCDKGIVPPGKIWMLNPGQVHSGIPVHERTITYEQLNISLEWMQQAAIELYGFDPGLPEFPAVVADVPQVAASIPTLQQLVRRSREPLLKQSATIAVASRLLEAVGPFKPLDLKLEPGAVMRMRELLSENTSERITLDTLARESGLSRYHLIRVFKRETGLTPHQFHIQKRLERAKKLLFAGCSMASTAFETGFADQSHFANTFKRYVGATPRHWLLG
ncbi:MAG: AraC family transcriptional regulator [Desulfovibrionales bacterium]